MRTFLLLTTLMLSACLTAHGRQHARLVPAPMLDEHQTLVSSELSDPTVDVLYVTDRAVLDPSEPARHYGYERSRQIRWGTASVTLGKEGLTAGDLAARTSTPGRAERWPVRVTDVDEQGILEPGDAEFMAVVAERIRQTGSGDVYITVHGIASGFGTSLFDLAQLWHHLGRRGVPIAYSWPSGKGGFIEHVYQYERESGEFTVPHLEHLLQLLGGMPEVERVNLIAHSRGSDVVLTTLRELSWKLASDGMDAHDALKIDTLVLAAADISLELFEHRVIDEGVTDVPRRTVLYISERDKALSASSWMHGGPRIGTSRAEDLEHLTLAGGADHGRVEVVDCRLPSRGNLHSYYMSSPEVLGDVLRVLDETRHTRQSTSAVAGGGRSWMLSRGIAPAP